MVFREYAREELTNMADEDNIGYNLAQIPLDRDRRLCHIKLLVFRPYDFWWRNSHWELKFSTMVQLYLNAICNALLCILLPKGSVTVWKQPFNKPSTCWLKPTLKFCGFLRHLVNKLWLNEVIDIWDQAVSRQWYSWRLT